MRVSGYVAVPFVLAALLVVTACGGGGGAAQPQANQQTPQQGGQAAPPPPPTGEAQASSVDETAQAKLFKPTAETPKFFRDLVELGTPLVVFFYSTDDPVHSDVLAEVNTVEKRYSNQAEFIKVNMDSAYKMASQSEDKLAEAEEHTNLARELNVSFTPHVVIMDRNSMITYSHAGYIDAKTLEQELFKALKR